MAAKKTKLEQIKEIVSMWTLGHISQQEMLELKAEVYGTEVGQEPQAPQPVHAAPQPPRAEPKAAPAPQPPRAEPKAAPAPQPPRAEPKAAPAAAEPVPSPSPAPAAPAREESDPRRGSGCAKSANWSIRVFWDIANCTLHRQDSVHQTMAELRRRVAEKVDPDGRNGWNYQTARMMGNFYLQISRDNWDSTQFAQYRPTTGQIGDLRDLGLNLVDPGPKQGADDCRMRDDLTNLATDEAMVPHLVVVVVITGDRDFGNPLRLLIQHGYDKVVLVYSGKARSAFLQNVDHSILWDDVRYNSAPGPDAAPGAQPTAVMQRPQPPAVQPQRKVYPMPQEPAEEYPRSSPVTPPTAVQPRKVYPMPQEPTEDYPRSSPATPPTADAAAGASRRSGHSHAPAGHAGHYAAAPHAAGRQRAPDSDGCPSEGPRPARRVHGRHTTMESDDGVSGADEGPSAAADGRAPPAPAPRRTTSVDIEAVRVETLSIGNPGEVLRPADWSYTGFCNHHKECPRKPRHRWYRAHPGQHYQTFGPGYHRDDSSSSHRGSMSPGLAAAAPCGQRWGFPSLPSPQQVSPQAPASQVSLPPVDGQASPPTPPLCDEEERMDPHDHRFYTRQEFIGFYGPNQGTERWHASDPDSDRSGVSSSDSEIERAEASKIWEHCFEMRSEVEGLQAKGRIRKAVDGVRMELMGLLVTLPEAARAALDGVQRDLHRVALSTMPIRLFLTLRLSMCLAQTITPLWRTILGSKLVWIGNQMHRDVLCESAYAVRQLAGALSCFPPEFDECCVVFPHLLTPISDTKDGLDLLPEPLRKPVTVLVDAIARLREEAANVALEVPKEPTDTGCVRAAMRRFRREMEHGAEEHAAVIGAARALCAKFKGDGRVSFQRQCLQEFCWYLRYVPTEMEAWRCAMILRYAVRLYVKAREQVRDLSGRVLESKTAHQDALKILISAHNHGTVRCFANLYLELCNDTDIIGNSHSIAIIKKLVRNAVQIERPPSDVDGSGAAAADTPGTPAPPQQINPEKCITILDAVISILAKRGKKLEGMHTAVGGGAAASSIAQVLYHLGADRPALGDRGVVIPEYTQYNYAVLLQLRDAGYLSYPARFQTVTQRLCSSLVKCSRGLKEGGRELADRSWALIRRRLCQDPRLPQKLCEADVHQTGARSGTVAGLILELKQLRQEMDERQRLHSTGRVSRGMILDGVWQRPALDESSMPSDLPASSGAARTAAGALHSSLNPASG
eukprot:TRINITY_DN1733_c0_g1_i3.p1 TRINITY_DN1733_c0_g1~~TRINITY_DN1733_c0_g1_i3.p1  ORF type:complete len:1282 (+),score=325.71 TRINITY_DN1733_c0_g1_i3:131-3847(+)